MVAPSRRVQILVPHASSSDCYDTIERFENRYRVLSAPAKIIDFPSAWTLYEMLNELRNIEAIDVITNLFPLISIDAVYSPFDVTLNEVTQKSMQFNSSVIRTR
jgi:hypothetical protein